MARQETSAPPDEQLAQAYDKAQEYLKKGSFGRALRWLRRIESWQPGYRDIATLIPQAVAAKRVQDFVQRFAVTVGLVAFVVAWLLGVQSDLALLLVGAAGIGVGVIAGNILYAWRAARRASRDAGG